MAKLAEAYVHLDIGLSESDRGQLQAILTKRARAHARELFNQEPEFAVYVEQGSLRMWVIVAGALFLAIERYGSFRSGVDYIIKDARTFSERVLADFQSGGINDADIIRFERRLGTAGRIRRLVRHLDRVDRLPADERQNELALIRKELLRIAKEIEDPRDLLALKSEIPRDLLQSLPEPQPKRAKQLAIGLRPEEWRVKAQHRLPVIAALGPYPVPSQSNRFRLVKTTDGFRLVPVERGDNRR